MNIRLSVTMIALCATVGAMTQPMLAFGKSPEQKEVELRGSLEGCQVIPYQDWRETCTTDNSGLHTPEVCQAQGCQKSAGEAANIDRRAAWTECARRRTAINGAFDQTLSTNQKFMQKPMYKKWPQQAKTAMGSINTKIKGGQRGHRIALKTATDNVAACDDVIKE